MAETAEQNKSEEPTPFKLKRAREKGSVARGTDLGFFSSLVGLAIFSVIAGADVTRQLADMMRRTFSVWISAAHDPQHATLALASSYAPALQAIAVLGGTIMAVVALFEVIQVRGLVFTFQPLKPDFSRLNPAKGLKRVFSTRMLKETLKSILKLATYALGGYLVIRYAFDRNAQNLADATSLTQAMSDGGFQLLSVFVIFALAFAIIDQVIARREFLKQMRMSRSELTREFREREGEPRIKQKRKQLHAEFAKQTRNLGDLRGSDMLIVNPEHYAVGLAYNADEMSAPKVTTKGRNRFALLLKRKAARLSIVVFESPPLARALYRSCEKGSEVSSRDYRAVADLYLKLAQKRSAPAGPPHV